MKPPSESFSKGDAVEEWVDLKFFRPIGAWIVRRLARTRVTADEVTLWALVTGLLAGHLFVYADARLNFAGFLLFVVSDVFDSADGQLARFRGTTSRWGRIVDGLSDNARWANFYLHLIFRLAVLEHDPGGALLAVAAGVAQSFQATAIDGIRLAYLELSGAGGRPVDLPERVARVRAGDARQRIGLWLYRIYVNRIARLLPATLELVRRDRGQGADARRREARGEEFAKRQRAVVANCAWLGHNLRFALLGLLPLLGGVRGFLWITLVPLTVVMASLLYRYERNAASLLRADATAVEGAIP
ncbi:MAG: CDP-alcohol phosphatidyltransferase family protein [Hyphomicrobiales bacterium]